MEMLLIFLSFNAIYALVPLVVIAILILAAAGLTRGKDVFEIFGFGTLFGFAQGQGGGTAGKGLAKQKVNLKDVKLLGIVGGSPGPAMRMASAINASVGKVKSNNLAKKETTANIIAGHSATKAAEAALKTGKLPSGIKISSSEQNDLTVKLTKMTGLSTQLEAVKVNKTVKVRNLGAEQAKKKNEQGYVLINPVAQIHHDKGEITKEKFEKTSKQYIEAKHDYYKTLAKVMEKHWGEITPTLSASRGMTKVIVAPYNIGPTRPVGVSAAAYASAQSTIFNKQWLNQERDKKIQETKQIRKQEEQQERNEARAKFKKVYDKNKLFTVIAPTSTVALLAGAVVIPPLAFVAIPSAIAINTAARWKLMGSIAKVKKEEDLKARAGAEKTQPSSGQPPSSSPGPRPTDLRPSGPSTPRTPPTPIFNRDWLNLQKMRLQQAVSNPEQTRQLLKQKLSDQLRNTRIPDITNPALFNQQLNEFLSQQRTLLDKNVQSQLGKIRDTNSRLTSAFSNADARLRTRLGLSSL